MRRLIKPRYFCVTVLLFAAGTISAHQLTNEQIAELIEKDGCVTLDRMKVKICKADYSYQGDTIGALSFQPLGLEKSPGILLVPGFRGDARRHIRVGNILAAQGFACLAVDHPGFGKSHMKPDFVGSNTIKALLAGLKKLRDEPYVDKNNVGVFGYSRGGMAASLLVLESKDVKAAVLGAGVYDYKKAYDEVTIEGIRANMKAEAGTTDKAIKERSSILRMDKLKAPVMILHSEQDENVPVSQAYALRDRLTELKKDFEIHISPRGKHGFMDGEFVSNVVSFFSRRLKGVNADVKVR
jgi:dienelactone hydrolase